jgi:hypothetical protein
MNFDELAQAITREVLKRLRESEARPCVVVLAPRCEELAARVRACLGEGTDILFCGEDAGSRPVARYILPELSCPAMADLAVGRASDRYAAEALDLLLRGVAVETLGFEYRAHADTAPGPLYALYERHEKTLASYGLRLCLPKPPEAAILRRRLVTAEDVRAAGARGVSTLRVPASAKITPLAADTAGNLHISIIREG